MKKLFILISIASLALGSCRENKTETKEVIREVRVETETPQENKEGILERAAKKVDKEVNQEIDKKFVIVSTYAVTHPRTVVVHPFNTSLAI